MLGGWVFEQRRASGRPIGRSCSTIGSRAIPTIDIDIHSSPEKLAMLASAVSSKLLQSMARAQGFRFQETLTGFKQAAISPLITLYSCGAHRPVQILGQCGA